MNYRLYGKSPFKLIAVHGGPGAPGSVSTLAKGLAQFTGVIEPFQTERTVSGQVEELYQQIKEVTNERIYLFGHSWGAWIVYLFSYRYPEIVKKLFLIGSGAFDVKYLKEMNDRRMSSLSDYEKKEYISVIEALRHNGPANSNEALRRLGELTRKTDNYCVEDLPENNEDIILIDGNQYRSVWNEGVRLREEGCFIEIAKDIKCPVRVLHGKYDPTPINGIVESIKDSLTDFKWYEIDKSGHKPWKEKHGKEEFWKIVKEELNNFGTSSSVYKNF